MTARTVSEYVTGSVDSLRLASGALAIAVAGIHLYWGIPRFVAYASVGVMADPRPLAFVLSGHVIAGAVTLVAVRAFDARRIYFPGIVLMVVHLVSYAAWHTILSHGGAGSPDSHTHGSTFAAGILVVVEHLLASPLALAAKSAEFGLLVLLAVLLVAERRA